MEKDGTGKNDCCKDEQKQLKIEKDQKTATSVQLSLSLATALPVSHPVYNYILTPAVTENLPFSNGPPRSSQLSVYIRNCTFRI